MKFKNPEMQLYADLHEAGRVEEALQLLREQIGEEQWADFQARSQKLNKVFAQFEVHRQKSGKWAADNKDRIDQIEKYMANFREAGLRGEKDKKAAAWLAIGSMSLIEADPLYPFLPDLLKRRGRPSGSTVIDDELLAEIAAEKARTGGATRAAVRTVLRRRGETSGGEFKNRVNYVASEFDRRAKK